MKASIYYLSLESDYPVNDKEGLFLGPKGNVLYRGSGEFKKKASIEGSARLMDGRVLNFHSRVDGEIRWAFVDAPYGLGVKCPLIPMRSVAVDPKQIPLNSIVHIKETEGMILQDGSIHDGIWLAVDVGSSIKGNRIDLFAGAGIDSMKQLFDHGIEHMSTLTLRVTEKAANCD
jgi:3D (Asp-Asp-Asp) domain-containing protein